MNMRLAACGSNGMYPTSSTISSGMRCSRSSSASRRPWRWASARSATHSVAVRNAKGADPQRDQVRLAGAGRAQEDDVLAAVQEVELAEVQDQVALEARLEGEVELLKRFACREPGGLDAGLAAVAVAAVGLGLQQGSGELLVGPLVGARSLGELGQLGQWALSWRNRCASSVVARVMRSGRRSAPPTSTWVGNAARRLQDGDRPQASSPVSRTPDPRLVDRDLDAATDQAGVEAVVVGVDAQVRIGRDPRDPAPRRVRHRLRQRAQLLVGEPVDRPGPQRLVRAGVDLQNHASTGLESRWRTGDPRSSSPRSPATARRRPWPARLAEPPPDPKLAAEPSERVARPSGVAVNAGLTVPDQLVRQPAEPLQAASDPGQQILSLRAEHHRE